jgi:hypothetical protein
MTVAENNSFFQNTNTNNIVLGRFALVSVTNGLNNFAGGSSALAGLTTGNENIGIGISALTTVTSGSYNIGIGSQSQLKNSQGIGNVNIGFQSGANATGSNYNTAIGYGSLSTSTSSGYNLALGYNSGNAINTGSYNVVVGGNAGDQIAGVNNNVIISDGAGNLRLYIGPNGQLAFGPSISAVGRYGQILTSYGSSAAPFWRDGETGGLFNPKVSQQIGYAVGDRLFDLTGVSGGTYTNLSTIVTGATSSIGVAATMPSVTSSTYIIHSIYITNTAATDAEITGRIDHTLGLGGTNNTVDHVSFFASRLPVPSGSAVELLKKPMILLSNDSLRLQSTTPSGGGGVSGQLFAYIVYEQSLDYFFQGTGLNLASTSPTNVYQSTGYPSVIESIRITNYSNIGDYRISIYWTNSADQVQGYLAYNLVIPAYSTVELLEKIKRVAAFDIIKAVPEVPNVLSIQVSAKKIA